jgi:hypothetical protein
VSEHAELVGNAVNVGEFEPEAGRIETQSGGKNKEPGTVGSNRKTGDDALCKVSALADC